MPSNSMTLARCLIYIDLYSVVVTCKSTVPVPVSVAEKEYDIAVLITK